MMKELLHKEHVEERQPEEERPPSHPETPKVSEEDVRLGLAQALATGFLEFDP